MGYRVFPCIPGNKHPITQHGFKDASTEPSQIERWWARHPSANIGIAAEGMLVVDIDGADNPWPGDPDRAADLAGAGAVARTPRGGRHYLFRRPEGKGWKCSTSRLAHSVDVRTDGGYIVAAPSEIEEGPYRWGEGLDLDDPLEQLPDPPAWLVGELDVLVSPESPTLAHVAADDAEANAIPAGQRNATLARLAGTMRRVGMTGPEMASALVRVNQDRCLPPLAAAEVERITASIARYAPDAVARAMAENHFDQMFADGTDDDSPDNPDPGPIPDELLRVPDFIDEVMRYTLDTAPYPEPVLAFTGALALQAFLAGRKVRDAMDNRTNLYVLSLANSGVGKDHARKVNARILYEAGLADCLGTSFASGEGIEDRLFVQPATRPSPGRPPRRCDPKIGRSPTTSSRTRRSTDCSTRGSATWRACWSLAAASTSGAAMPTSATTRRSSRRTASTSRRGSSGTSSTRSSRARIHGVAVWNESGSDGRGERCTCCNDKVQQRGRLDRFRTSKSRYAGPVCCNGWFGRPRCATGKR